MPKLYLSKSFNPYENLALEEAIFDLKEEALLLWVNEPSVIIGANQNVLNEVNMDVLKKKNIHLVRRKSGGGAVYHDLGNLNFSFFSKELNKEKWCNTIIRALSRFNLEVKRSGRNDLLYQGQKISGTAYYADDGFYLFHGTLMVDVNLKELEEVLFHRSIKYEKRGIESLQSRVLNLSSLHPKISVSSLKAAIIEEYQKEGIVEYAELDYPKKRAYALMKKDYLYDYLKEDLLHIEYKAKNAVYDFYLDVKDDKIIDLKIYSDSLDIEGIKRLKNVLKGQVFSQFENILKMNLD